MARQLFWDMINPLTGTPFCLDDANLYFSANGVGMDKEPRDIGFVPYPNQKPAAKPEKKPFRRTPKQPTPTATTAQPTMSTFKYYVVPKAKGGFSTRVLLTDEFDDATIDNAVAATTGLTAAQCAAVVTAYINQIAAFAAGGGWSHDFHGLFSVRPSTGGASDSPDGFNNASDINANITIAINPGLRVAWQGGLTLESQGQVGLLIPEIDSIINLHDGTQDTYTGGEILQLNGDNLDLGKTDLSQGVFYTTEADPGVKVRIASYGPIGPTQANAIMPTGVTGPLRIYVVNMINGTLREALYVRTVG